MSMLPGKGGRRLLCAAVLTCAAATMFPWAALRAQESDEIPVVAGSQDGRVQVLVEFADPPAARVYGDTLRQATDQHRSIADATAAAVRAARSQISKIAVVQDRFMAALPSDGNPEVIYKVQKAYNGISLRLDAAEVGRLRSLPGVRAVHPVELEYPTNATSVPFIGAPNLWENNIGLPSTLTGAGVKIGIIDTGLDYLHADFGGTGLLADYQTESTNTANFTTAGSFPTAKVAGGTDLVGDAYNGGNTPVPDPNPMDCNGHGSHVAGTAAGYGVTSAGTTFAGPYNTSVPFGSLRIGPGVAPQASLYSIRVFGCTGGTGVTVQAIDWAMDPNGDNDLSDHLDVINMSLGSGYGGAADTSAAASDNAAAAGVIVVNAAGNKGDTFFIHDSPGTSGRAIAVAAITDSGIPGALVAVSSPAAIAGNFSASAANSFAPTPAPNPSGQTANIVLALDAANGAGPSTTDGCTALTNAAAIAGNIALIDRGTCGFQVKANNAQAAGAIAVIIANNVAGDPSLIAMGATGTTPVTIPALFMSQADRNTFVANAPVNATLSTVPAGDTIASFTSRGPRQSGPGPVRLKPDVAAPGVNIPSVQTGHTCLTPAGCTGVSDPTGFRAGSQSLILSGTSMATPHIAGTMALLRQEHPTWTVEELKALVMNGALHNASLGANGAPPLYGPGRVGAGRVDTVKSAQSDVIALNADDSGLVSVSFETTEVVGTATQVKKVRLVNTGTSAATYDLSIDTRVDAPGVAFSLPGGSTISIPAGDSVTIDVQMDATGSLMNHTKEASIPPGQAAPAPLTALGTLARHWLTEEASYLVLSQSGNAKLRLPLYVASRAASTMAAPATIPTGGAPTGSTTIPLSGSDVCTGTLGAGPTCTGTFPTMEESLVTPFELQVVSPSNNTVPPYADIQYAGVAYTGSSLLFGVSTWGDWSTPTDVSFNIYIDNNSDGTWDRVLFNSNPGTMAANLFGTANVFGQDAFLTAVFNLATSGVSTQQFVNRVSAAGVDSHLFNNNVMFLGATPASLGITGPFRWKVVTCPGSQPLCLSRNGFDLDEANGPYTYNHLAQGLNFSGANLADDLNGSTLPVAWNTANMTTNGSLGALLLHHHNKAGQRAQTVALQGTATTDLAITKSVSPTNPTLGQNVVFTLTVTNNGPTAATGVAVTDNLPAGLTYVSDDGGGAYSTGTGIWTVGSLAVSASATLHITATVETTDQVCNLAQITAVTPLDPTPANNQSTVCVMAPRSADLAVSMTVSSPTVLVGGSVTYTITVKNNGTDPAYAIDLQEAFPAFPLLNPASFTASQGSYNPSTGLWNLANLGSGFSATLAINVTAPNTAGALTNQATASAGTSDPNNANNTASATTTVLSPANVTATKTVSGTFRVGQTVTYTVTLHNSAAFDQQNNPGHEFTDVLPTGLTLVSATATSGTAATSGNTATWDGVVPAGGSVTVTITATINAGTAGTTISNQGTVSYDADGNGTNEASNLTDDPGVGGAADPTSFLVLSPATVSGTMTVSGSFAQGTNVTYTVVLTNSNINPIVKAAQGDNPGPEFVDVLPSQLALVSASASSGVATATIATNTVTWNGSIPAGGSVTITIVALVKPGTGGQTISNQGTINFDADGNGTNESSALTDDPTVTGAANPTTFVALDITQVPTLGEIGLLTLCLLLAGAALLRLRRRTA
ncbi:MAG TPA: IPTL-CTERM sorting domain-containing protein [Thermoanaerobaculia bacterium]|nr:IPTL-CTERM sorting domain-containing protein [Thermoanaerobaculia bacterium]